MLSNPVTVSGVFLVAVVMNQPMYETVVAVDHGGMSGSSWIALGSNLDPANLAETCDIQELVNWSQYDTDVWLIRAIGN